MKFFLLIFGLYALSHTSNCNVRKNNVQTTLAERIEELSNLSLKKPVIRLNSEKFRTYVGAKSQPRNYTVIVMMTAMSSHRQCQVCRTASDEFSLVANAFRNSPAFSGQLFFAMVDFDEGSDVFQQLSINSAPVFLHFSPKGKIRSPEQMDIQRVGFSAEQITKWVAEKTDVQIRIVRPPSYTGMLALIVLLVLFSSLLYVRRNSLEFLFNRTSWALSALAIVFAMTSGQMWNHIRGPPLMQKTQRGIAYIHGSTNGQFVIETYIIIILNVAIALGMILMNEAMKSRGEPKKRKIIAIFGLGITAVFFSLLLSVFKSKTHGYPYTFLFK